MKQSRGVSALLDRARALRPLLKERALQTEKDRMVSAEVIAAIADAGIFQLLQPRRFGGLEGGFEEFVRINIELARGCGSTAWCAAIAMIHNWVVGLYPLETQEEVWKDRSALICGSYAPSGTCERVAGGYRISGRWSFASNCDHSSWYIVGTLVPADDAHPKPTPAWALIPRSDARIEDTWYSAGMAGTGSKTIAVDEPVFVAEHHLLPIATINSGAAPGSRVHASALYRLTFTGSAPYTLCSVPVGIALGAIEDFLDLARTRMAAQPGGPPRPMRELESVLLAIAEASASVDGVMALLLRDSATVDLEVADGQVPAVEERILFRRNQAYAARQSAHAVSALFDVMGANAGDLASPVQRAWRDTHLIAHHLSLGWTLTGSMYGQQQLGLTPRGSY
jgi:alkylation response protein AidB-like acyl-CoA dehydrogenase